MKLTKRLLAMLLTVVMVLTMLPAIALTASAADTTETLTASDFAATGTSYAASSGVSKGGTARYAAYTAKNSSNIQFNKKQNCYIVSTTSGGKVKSVTVTIASGSQAIIVKGSNTAYTTSNAYSNGTEIARGTSTFTATPTTDYEYFAIVGNANGAVYISSVQVVWTSGASKTLSSISLSGSYPTSFTTGDTFDHTGMVVTATYSDSSTANVTSSATWSSPNMSTAGTKTVTVSYTEGGTTKTATYGITVNPRAQYTLTYSVNGSTTTSQEYGGDSVTLPSTATTPSGYTFVGWLPNTYATNDTAPTGLIAPGGSYTMPSSNTTLYAVYAISSGNGNSDYTLVTNTNQLSSGLNVVIAASGYNYAMSTTQNNNNRAQASITKNGSTITLGTGVCEFTLGEGTTSGTWSFYDAGNSGYICAASSGSNYLHTESTNTANGSFAISVTSAGVATVTAQGAYTRNTIRYNASNNPPIFACYASDNTNQKDIALYVKSATSYSGYTTSPKTLSSIALSGTYPTTFTQGDTFSHTGMVVTATYSDGTTANVTSSATFSDYNMSNTGSQTVTVSYTEGGVTKTATYTITINAATTYSVTVTPPTGGSINTSDSTSGLHTGDTVTLTAAPDTGYQFTSWTVSGAGSTTSTSASPITITIGTSPVTVSATFSKINYTITYENTYTEGTVGIAKRSTQTVTANYGDTVDVTVTANSGYAVGDSITVTDTTNNVSISTTQSGNVFTFTMPAGNVTVASNANTFTVLPTYTATFTANSDELTTLEDSGHEGNTITLPTLAQMTALGLDEINYFDGSGNTTFTFAGWAPVSAISIPTGAQPTGYVAAGGTYTFGAADVDFRAIYVNGSGGDGFTLSYTYSGTTYYAGLYGSNILAAETNAANAATYYIEDGTYLYFMNGETKTYVNHTGSSSTNLSTSTSTKQAWTITESNGTIVFQSTANTGRHLSFNYNNGNPRFNAVSGGSTYTLTKSGSGSYLTEETVAGNACTVTFYDTDGTTVLQTGTVYEGNVPAFTGTTPTKDPSGIYYYTFAGWNTSANQSSTVTITAIGSSESTRSYYPVFTEAAATFTLNLSGRIKVATEGSFQSTVLTPSLTTEQTGCSANLSSISASYTSGSASIATFTTTGNVLTVTGVAEGSITLNVTATYDDGHTATKSVTITVIAGNGGTAGGYKLITQKNTFTTDSGDVNNYDWSGEYIFAARTNGTASNINSLYILTPSWSGDTASLPDSSANAVLYTFDPEEADDFGAATAQNGTITASALHTGEGDYVEGATATADGYVFDRIVGFKDSSDNDITDHYVFVFERVDEINNYYTIRIKGTNYYLKNSSTGTSGDNHLGGLATADTEQSDELMWHIRWASTGVDAINGLSSVTPDMVLIESVEALESDVSRAPLFNQSAHLFRTYGSGAYGSQLNNSGGGYNLFLYGKQIPFEAEIIYDDVERNTTNAKIEVPYNYTTMTNSDTLLLEGLLDPESYPGWTILNSSIPTWTLVGAYNSDNSSFTPSASVSAISGTQNAEFHVAQWSASDIGKYYVVKINYQVQDPDGVTHDVPQQAMIVVVDADLTFNTIINESSSMDHTGSYTVPSRDGTSGVDLNAYIVDNYGIQYSQRSIPDGFELTQPSSWSYTSQRGYTYAIDSAGVITWTPANILKDDVVVITATAGLTENGVAQTVNAGTFTLYVNKLAYTAEVQDASDSSNTTIPYAASAFAVTLGNFANNNGDAPGSATYSINSATEWNWTAVKEADGTAVPITRTSTGATINVTGLDAGTRIVVRATNVIATSNTTSGVHTVVTVAGKVFTVGEDTRMTAVNDSFVLDFDRDAKLNVLANDRYADGATLTLGAAPTGITLTKNSDNTVTFGVPGGQLTTATYTFTYTLSKSGETDSTATVTVKPSSAIYYEDTNDDFFTYSNGTRGRWSEVGADNAWLQDASAATDGYDAANNSLTWSAGIAHKANVGKDTSYGDSSASGTWPKVEFTFVGNAFALSMMRNNYTGLVAVYVDGTKVKNLPTAYGATGGEYDPEADYGGFIYESSDSNYGMPAFYWAADGGTVGTHSVKVEVLYSSMYDHNSPKSNYDVYIDGVTIYNPISGSTAYKYISFRDTVLATGSLGVPATQAHDYAATLTPASISIGTGHTGSLHLSLTDAGATVYTGYTVVYSSSDTSVATVTTNGSLNTTTGVNTATVTGVGEGTATITATITTPGGTTLTRTATVTVTDTVYTVTYILPNGEQEVSYANSTIQLGTGVTHLTAAELAAYDAHNYSFRGWLNTALPSDTDTMPGALRDDGATVTLTGDATYYAVYRYGTTDTDFVLKTDLNNPLVDGDTILIYETEGTGDKYVLSNQNYGSSGWQLNYRSGDAAIPSHNMITKSNTELYWDVVATTGGFYLKDKDGNYLSATDSDGELVVLSSPDSAKSVWNATTDGVNGENSVFIYTNQSAPQYLQHFSGYPEFCCYTWDEAYSNKNEMQIYVQAELANYYATTLGIATPSYTVTYKVNGTTVDTEAVREGNDPSFTAPAASTYSGYDAHEYTFLGWIPSTISPDSTEAPATIYEAGDPYTLSGATTFHAVFSYTAGSGGTTAFVTEASELTEGTYAIVAKRTSGNYWIMTSDLGSASTKRYQATDSSTDDSTDILGYTFTDAMKWNVEEGATSGTWYLKSVSEDKYATWSSGNSGNLSTTAYALTADDGVVFKSNADSSRELMLNSSSGSDYFAFYTGTQTSMQLIRLGGTSSAYYATTLEASAPVTHDYAASISPASLALHPGETGSVSATLTDNGATVTGATPTYTTSLASVATVAADGTVTAVANGNATITATYTVDGTDYTATCSVAVTTLATYNVTYYVNGSQYGQVESVTQGDSPSFTAPSYDVSSYNAHAYEFLGWKEGSALSADTTETQTLYVAGNTHVISGNTTYYAVYRYTEGGGALTEAIDLGTGASGQYVIAANVGGTYYAMSNTFATKISGTSITNPGSSISSSDATNYVVTIAKTNDGFTISNGTNLLGYPSSGTDFTTDTHPYWSITTGTHGSYRVANTNTTSRAITYRAGSTNKFAPYATSNINGTEYYDVEIIPVGDSSSATYYATTLNVAAAHSYVASISPTSVTIEAGQETTAIGTLTDNGITTTAYTPTYTSSNTGVATVSSIGYVDAISAGSATITVSYSVDGTTYSATCAVTVTAAPVVTTYTVSYYVNGSLYETETVAENGHPDFDAPTTDVSAYDAQDYSFAGWAANTVSDTTTAPTMYTASTASSYTVTGDVTFHAVYTWTEGGSGSGSGSGNYELVSASEATAGSYVIGALRSSSATNAYYFATGTVGSGDMNTTSSSVTVSGTSIAPSSLPTGTMVFTFSGDNSNGFTIATSDGDYLGYTAASNRKLAFASSYSSTKWTVADKSGSLNSKGTYLSCKTGTYTISENSTGTGAIRGYANTTVYRAIYLFKLNSSGSGSGSSTSYYTTTLAAGDGETATLSVSPSSMSLSTGGYGQIAVTAANGGANAYVTATSSSNSVAQVYALNDGNNTFGVTAGSAGSATITIRYFDSSANQLASQTVSVTVTAASGTGGTNADYGRVGSDGNAPTTSGSTNAGTRGVVATSISQKAADYYTAKGVTWADLTALSGVYTNSSVTAASGNALKSQLDSLMNLTNTVTYSSLTTYWPNTDKSNGSSQNLYIYSNVTSNSSVSREHVWPKSRGQFYESGAGSDLQHLRPEESTVNSTRGNHTMGYVNGVINNPSTKTYGGNTVLWYNGSYSSNDCSGLVEVMDCCKGDVARILLYVYTAYPENTNLFTKTSGGGSGNNASDGNKVIESLNTLLEWCALDPVDTWEMSRNDAVQTIQGNRNVYIDYPELAWMIFNLTPPTTMQTPSGQAAAGNVGTRNSANYYTSAVNNTAIMSEEPAPATRGGATRAIGDENSSLPVTGAVMLNGIGQISNNDDVMAYLASYGAQNCLVVPANGSVVFYLTGGSAESQIAIGASALNGTGTTLKVYQISAVSGSSATGTVLLEQSLVSSTEMYFAINGIAWTGEKSNVLMVRNEGSAPMLLTNLRAATGTVEGHISTGGTESVGGATRAITRSTDNELQMVIDASAILAGIAGVQSINDGTFDETPVDPVDPVDPVESDIVLRGNSISLNGQIDVNFYVDVPADLLASGVYATLDGVRADFTEGTYGTMVSKKLPAKEMNTKVTLKLYAADGTPLTFLNGSATVTEHSYSVQDYLTYVIGNPATYGDELVKLCKAMSDYGSYTQIALDFDADNAKAIYLADEIAAVTCTGCDYSFTANTEHISFLGASVVTESETAIRVYFALSGEGFTATVDGEPAAIQTNERGTFVEIANISAKNLGDTHTISVTNGSETVTVSDYSAYSYVQSVLSYADASDSLKLAVKALKLYGDLAAAYFNK